MEKQLGNIKIYIEDSYEAMSARAANIFAEAVKAKPNGVFGFATGGTPVGMYEELVKKFNAKEIDFSGIKSFNLDEYYPIKASNDQSYRYFMDSNLFKHINILPENVNIQNGEAEDIEKECDDYENKLQAAGGVDLQILGIGLNGHIGFNEPCEYFPSKTHYVELDESTIEANARFFASKDEVPKSAVSMGIKTIMSARGILLLVNGKNKSGIVRETLLGKITPQVPASVLQLHQNVTIVMDKDAASEL